MATYVPSKRLMNPALALVSGDGDAAVSRSHFEYGLSLPEVVP